MFEKKIIDELIEQEMGESTNAYSAFLFYAQMLPKDRNAPDGLSKVASHIGLAENTLKLYRVQFRWEERVNLLDAHFYKIQFEKRIESLNESNQKYAEDTKQIQAEAIRASKKAILVVNELLERAVMSGKTKESKWVQALQPDGSHKAVAQYTTIEMDCRLADVAPLLRAAVAVPMQAAGLPTEAITPNVTRKIGEVGQMTDEEIALQVEKINKEKAKILNEQEISGVQ